MSDPLEYLPLFTERLVITEITESDVPFFLQLFNSEGYKTFIGDRGLTTESEVKKYIKSRYISEYYRNNFGFFIVRLRHMDFPIGIVGMTLRSFLEDVDFGFALLDEYMGQGYAYEASLAVLSAAAEELKMTTLLGVTTEDNIDSKNLLKKLGFQLEKQIEWENGEQVLQFKKHL